MDEQPSGPLVGTYPEDPSQPRTSVRRTALVAALCSALAFVAGAQLGGNRADPQPAGAPSSDDDRQRVRLSRELAQRAALQTARATKERLAPPLQLVGSVDFDAERTAEVGGRISGRITQIMVRSGDVVRAGDPLAEIESATLGDAIALYLSAQAHAIASRSTLRRETGLASQQLTTAQSLEQARASAEAYAAEVRGAEQRLLAMGLSADEIHALGGATGPRKVVLRAPIAGQVISRQGVVGQTVEPTSTLLRIADMAELWVLLDVFERDLAHVRAGDQVEISTESHPGRTFRGVVGYVEATIDTHTRTARVRVEVDNTERLLRPGQFVTARLRPHDANAREVVTIPRGAIVQSEGRPTVFVVVGDGVYEARQVELGPVDGDRVEVVRGLAEGDEVVSEGAFALKSEMMR